MPGFYLKKYWSAPKELGWLQNVRIVDQKVPLTNQMKLSGKEPEKYNIAVFFEASCILNPSVPYRLLLFFS